jgi:hypothetical protein
MKKALSFALIGVIVSVFCLLGGMAKTEKNDLPRNPWPAARTPPHHQSVKPRGEISLKPDVNFGKIPLYFIPNRGQVHQKAVFYARTSRYTLWMTKQGLVFDSFRASPGQGRDLSRPKLSPPPRTPRPAAGQKLSRDVSEFIFLGANKNPEIVPLDITQHKVNYFIGNNKKDWRTRIPTSKAVLYKNLYKSIDLKVYGNQSRVEYDWIVKPGGRVEDISFRYRNVKGVKIDNQGNLIVSTRFGELTHQGPVSYQVIDRKKVTVPSAFKKIGHRFGFQVGEYNPDFDLFIDPMVLTYSTYLGGSGDDWANDIAVDGNGCAYVTGYTESSNFPLQGEYQGSFSWHDAFITKLSSSGDALIYSTYLGGSGEDLGNSIAVDNSGCAYITGNTLSSNFPIYYAQQFVHLGDRDAFVTKISAGGDSLVYSTFLGTSGEDNGNGIAVDNNGSAYVAGCSYTTANWKGFAAKFSPDGTEHLYFNQFGHICHPTAIAVDSNGSAYLTGYTMGIPLVNAFQWTSYPGVFSAFVTKLSVDGSDYIYSTFLGGSGWDYAEDIAIDNNNYVYVTGWTCSTDFPVRNAYRSAIASVWDCFITKFYSEGNNVVYSTYFGGNIDDRGYGIAADSNGNAYISGYTCSTGYLYSPPITYPPFQHDNAGAGDVFLLILSADGDCIGFTYLGGGSGDMGYGLALDSSNSVYLTGETWSKGSSSFPTINPYQGSHAGGDADAFVSKIMLIGPPILTLGAPNGGELWYTGGTENITWNYSGLADTTLVRLVLLQDDADLGFIAENITISDNTYPWNVGQYDGGTAAPGNNYKIRIETMDTAVSDTSDNNFSIANSTITVTYPNGGETWLTGSSHHILWTSTGPVGNVQIDYSIDNGASWLPVIASTENDGDFLWSVLGTLSDICLVRVMESDGNPSDISDAVFSITPVPAVLAFPDFNTDGKGDILWRYYDTGGYNTAWLMETAGNTTPVTDPRDDPRGAEFLAAVNLDWQLCGAGDFDNDGNVDIFFTNLVDGRNVVWFLDGVNRTSVDWLPTLLNLDWKIIGSGDFNNDGNTDILFNNSIDGRNVVWYLDGLVSTGVAWLRTLLNMDWKMCGTGDFNNDGSVDVVFRNSIDGRNVVWYMDGVTRIGVGWLPVEADLDWKLCGTGDFNGDGNVDIVFRNSNDGRNKVWYLDGVNLIGSQDLTTVTGLQWKISNSSGDN